MDEAGTVQSYVGEPLAHSSDEDEDEDEEDQDGFTAAVLRERYESEVSVNEW